MVKISYEGEVFFEEERADPLLLVASHWARDREGNEIAQAIQYDAAGFEVAELYFRVRPFCVVD